MPYDPREVLRALRAERDELDIVIAYFEKIGGDRSNEARPATTVSSASHDDGPSIVPESDAFKGMSNPVAVRTYLSIAGVPQTPGQVARALKMGGIESEAKKFYSTIYTTLRRLEAAGEIQKLEDGRWVVAGSSEEAAPTDGA